MSDFCIINDAKAIEKRIANLVGQLPVGEFRTVLSVINYDLEQLILDAEQEAQNLQDDVDAADKRADKFEKELEKSEAKIGELEEELDSLREQLMALQDWRGVLASDPDPYDLHGLHDGNDTGHSRYARFWQKFRRTFTNPNTAE